MCSLNVKYETFTRVNEQQKFEYVLDFFNNLIIK